MCIIPTKKNLRLCIGEARTDRVGFKELRIVRETKNMTGKGIPKTGCAREKRRLEMSGSIGESLTE